MSLNGGRVADHRRMIVRLDTHRLQTLDQVREFLGGSQEIDLQPQTRADAYAFVAKTVQRFDYALRGKGRQGPAAPLPGQGDRPVSGSDHPPVASASDHRRDRRPARRPRAARSRVATPTPTSDCWPRSTRCTARCPVRPRASCAPAPSISSATACSAASITFCRWTTTILAG